MSFLSATHWMKILDKKALKWRIYSVAGARYSQQVLSHTDYARKVGCVEKNLNISLLFPFNCHK